MTSSSPKLNKRKTQKSFPVILSIFVTDRIIRAIILPACPWQLIQLGFFLTAFPIMYFWVFSCLFSRFHHITFPNIPRFCTYLYVGCYKTFSFPNNPLTTDRRSSRWNLYPFIPPSTLLTTLQYRSRSKSKSFISIITMKKETGREWVSKDKSGAGTEIFPRNEKFILPTEQRQRNGEGKRTTARKLKSLKVHEF